MKITYENAVLMVKDMDKARRFYMDVLAQKVKLDFGGALIFESGLSLWEISDDHIIPRNLGKEKIHSAGAVNFELNFETDDINACFSLLKKHRITFLHEINEEPWGQKTIRFFDPDHHLIEIGESLETFIKNFHHKGLTEEEISKKTSVPLDEVERILST